MIIRNAIKADISAVLEIWIQSGLKIRPNGRDRIEKLTQQLNLDNNWMLVAEVENQLAGVVLVTHDSRKGWINRLAVNPAYLRKGIATKLLKAAEQSLLDIGIEIFVALITDENLSSQKLFEKEGYKYNEPIRYYSKKTSPDV